MEVTMSFADWLAESRDRFREQPFRDATRETAVAFVNGAARRTIDSVLGDSVWDRDWDVLVVLDATRVDLMREVAPDVDELPDRVASRWSEASCSLDWIDRVFGDAHRADALQAGYVTANPFSGHDADAALSVDLVEGHDVGYLDEVWRDGWQDVGDGVETVPPNVVTDRAIDAWRRRDELDIDRLIVHYMQPHQPFVSRPAWLRDSSNLANLMEPGREAGFCIWEATRDGRFDADKVWEAYRENLHWVLADVTERLLLNCDARIALTADHGNGMGEWGVWGHPPGAVTPAVRKVPWLTVTGSDERTVIPDTARADETDGVETQLAALGYV